MTNPPPPPELFPQTPTPSSPLPPPYAQTRSYRIRRFATCLILFVLVVGGVYEIYLWKSTPTEIPTIKAETSLKQRPEQPGGIDIPNQDVLAYQQIDNTQPKTTVERLLPPPETPQDAPASATAAAPAPAPEPQPVEASALAVPAATADSEATAPAPVAKKSAEQKSEAAQPAPSKGVIEVAEKPAAAPPAKQPAATSVSTNINKPAIKGNFRVQLASFPDEEEAQHEMNRMQERFASQLGSAKLHLVKADLGTRGIYYRVQSSQITDADAHEICAALKNLKAGCIVVRP